MRQARAIVFFTLMVMLMGACSKGDTDNASSATTLKRAFEGKFLIGAALTDDMLENSEHLSYSIVNKHFSSITSTNALKWERFNPSLNEYTPELSDRFVAFGELHNLDIVGHTLFWHSQTPDWVFEDDQGKPLTRNALLERMRARVKTLAKRYGSRIKTWDVVNEGFEADGSLRQTKFLSIIGQDFMEQAFKIAAEELPPNTKLLYNDYKMSEAGRRDAVIAMIKNFRAKGIRIDGIGMQEHWELTQPSLWRVRLALHKYAAIGIPIHITELDIDYLERNWFFGASKEERERISALPETNPYPEADFPQEVNQKLSNRYEEIFSLYLDYADNIERVTFWGVTDADSWLNDWPVEGRTNYPFVFDRKGEPKPAFYKLLKLGNNN